MVNSFELYVILPMVISVACCYNYLGLQILSMYMSSDSESVVFVILSQSNEHHEKLAEDRRNNIYEQARLLRIQRPVVYLSHKDIPHPGAWAILPILLPICEKHQETASWIFFIEDRTYINLEQVLIALEDYPSEKEIFLGHVLHDSYPTIIHHFAFHENTMAFAFPNGASGFAISTTLLKGLCNRLRQEDLKLNFTIDPYYELALFMWDNGNGVSLQHNSKFCIQKGSNCATYPMSSFHDCGNSLPSMDSIYFAVKTCQLYHKDRVKVVQKTWGRFAERITFFSDVEDRTVPTVELEVDHVEQGHCAKTLEIMKYVDEIMDDNPEIQWLVIADDDSILGMKKLQTLLSCYNSNGLIALGQRYGFHLHSLKGYNYLTGGAGMVFSRDLVKILQTFCRCPSADTPDDMFLGACIAKFRMDVTHSPLFHQARPRDYPAAYFSNGRGREAVSFHKHWMVDPVKIYDEWFVKEDLELIESSSTSSHDEL